MNDLVHRYRELPANKAKLNKATLHIDTHIHTYTETGSALITSKSTEAVTSREFEKKDRHTTVAVAGVSQLPTLGKSLLTLNKVSRR